MSPKRGLEDAASWLRGRMDAAGDFLSRGVWAKELASLPTFRALFYKASRVVYLTARGLREDKAPLRAAALTFITGLSLVPLLAFAFAVAKGLGAYETLLNDVLVPLLDRVLGPAAGEGVAGSEVRAAIDQGLAFVQETDVRRLGTFGLAILLYTVVKLLGSIEQSFNEIWGVRKSRTFLRKLSDYLSIVVVVPLLLTTATAVTTAVQSQDALQFARDNLGLGALLEYYAKFSSLLAIWAGFTFVYLFLPNTRVRVRSALLGALVGGLLWQGAQVLHLRFQLGVANYNAIYSTFAAVPIFMFWLYLSWLTVLLGAEVAFAHQNEPAYRQVARAREHDHPVLEVLAVRAMARVAVAFLRGDPPLHAAALASSLGIPQRSLTQVLERLSEAGIVALADADQDDGGTVLPARDLEHVTIQHLLDALARRTRPVELPYQAPMDAEVERVLAKLAEERAAVPHNLTLRRLAVRCIEKGTEAPTEGQARAALEGA